MFEKFLTENAADFRQRYEGSFGFYRDENGKRMLSKLTSVGRVCVFVDSRGVEYKLNPDSERNIGFEFLPPKASWYNVDEGAVLVRRVAARQFQRGLSSKNTNIYLLSDRLREIKVDFPILEKIYLKSMTPQDAYRMWEKLPSVALSKQLALGKGGIVYLYENKIGTYAKKDSRLYVKLDEPSLWKTEVQDACRAVGCSVEVS
jgi:hypothetical protein